ncbi:MULTISPECIES: sugar phosphate isomerase/epimerase family protein [Halococcus]|uniref:Xylose isomerase domain-containing protein n=1 Tax=Halococcus salifodinae DSM 8989 TaxID=1227456 RepID=M0N402_9EURY|nr:MULTISPECIES: sugar phosphate isomerase/epimerase [Halococcus]EMA52586.1 xylose isomerase domain-containing protein [Halococcus salifodinae DSM 8989]
MARSAIQLYTLRALDEPLDELLARVRDAGFEGVEYANRIGDADADAVRTALDETGLESVAAHVGIDEIEDDPEATIEFYRSLGCDHLVVPWLDPECFETESDIEATADRLLRVAETVDDHDMALSYHNHDHEFAAVNGRPAFEHLAEATREPLGFELDCGWTAAAGVDPTAVLDRWGDRVSLVHISDADETRSSVEVGDGVLDVEACAAAVRAHDVEWAIYEHDDPDDQMASVAHGADVLERF